MKFFLFFFKASFLVFVIFYTFSPSSVSIAAQKSESISELNYECAIKTLGGEDDLIPWPLSQCPWQVTNLYGNWLMPSINTKKLLDTFKIEIYHSILGVSILRRNSDGSEDKGFIIPSKNTMKNNYYRALMYSSGGDLYYLSIYTYLSPSSEPKTEDLSCFTDAQQPIRHIVFVQHRMQNFLQCDENISESWLLQRVE